MRTEREKSARCHLRFARCCLVGYDQHQILDVQFGEGRTRAEIAAVADLCCAIDSSQEPAWRCEQATLRPLQALDMASLPARPPGEVYQQGSDRV